MKTQNIVYWAVRIIAAFIMLQTLFFKFTGAEESIYIFTQVGIEPWGRIGTGVMELIASILLLIPSTVWAGAIIGIGSMGGAMMTHVAIIGINVKVDGVHGDGGQLFAYAIITLLCCAIAFWMSQNTWPSFLKSILKVK